MADFSTKATSTDQAIGYGLVLAAGIIFTYYTLWVVVLPFVDEDHLLHQFFLPRLLAIILPIMAGVVVLFGLLGFTVFTMMRGRVKQKTS